MDEEGLVMIYACLDDKDNIVINCKTNVFNILSTCMFRKFDREHLRRN